MMTMDWDSPIDSNEAGSGFEVLAPGRYQFTVTAFTRATVKNGDMTGANMAASVLAQGRGACCWQSLHTGSASVRMGIARPYFAQQRGQHPAMTSGAVCGCG